MNTIGLLDNETKLVHERKLVERWEERISLLNTELSCKCALVETEVHVSGKIYCGRLDSIQQEFSGENKALVLKLREVVCKQNSSSQSNVIGTRDFKLNGYELPVAIKDGDCDCIWFSFNNGYAAIYLKKPTQ